jgi:hypothetical protein
MYVLDLFSIPFKIYIEMKHTFCLLVLVLVLVLVLYWSAMPASKIDHALQDGFQGPYLCVFWVFQSLSIAFPLIIMQQFCSSLYQRNIQCNV